MLMSYYPGQGLGDGVDIGLGYGSAIAWPMCKLHGVILTSAGTPVGKAYQTLAQEQSGLALVDSWMGVPVTAKSAPGALNNRIIGADTVQTITNDFGYFELFVIKGLSVTVTCPSFGKTVTVDTTGLDTIDLSTFF